VKIRDRHPRHLSQPVLEKDVLTVCPEAVDGIGPFPVLTDVEHDVSGHIQEGGEGDPVCEDHPLPAPLQSKCEPGDILHGGDHSTSRRHCIGCEWRSIDLSLDPGLRPFHNNSECRLSDGILCGSGSESDWRNVGSTYHPSRVSVSNGTIRAVFGFSNRHDLIDSGNPVGVLEPCRGYWINCSEQTAITVERN